MAHAATPPLPEPVVTVATLLAEPLLRGHVLVSPSEGLRRSVSWCLPYSEVDPQPQGRVAQAGRDLEGVAVHLPATLLAGAERAEAVLRRLVSRGAAAVLAWHAQSRREADLTHAARAAHDAGVVLLSLPSEADYRAVSQLVASKVLSQTAHVLEYSNRVHRALGEVFAHGAGLPAMARTMSQLSRTTALVVGMSGEVLAAGAPERGGDRGPLRVDAEIVRRLVVLHQEERQSASLHGAHAAHAKVVEIGLGAEHVHATVAPVTVGGEPYGIVVLVEDRWPADEHDLAQHAVIAEQGATLAGSELLRQRSVREAQERARDDFVDALLHSRFTDQHELAARARHYGFDPEQRFAVFVVGTRGADLDRRAGVERAAAAARAAAAVAAAPDLLALSALISSMIVVIRQLPERKDSRDAVLADREAARDVAERLHRAMRERVGPTVRVAYGRAGVGARGVAQSYREARTALALGYRVDAPAVCGYDDLRVFAAIQEAAASAPGQSFAAEVLEPLRRADGQTGNLEQIVLAYIQESGNLNAAARRLQLHRNTMLYKLERASRALEMDVRSAETQFMVWLAHHIDTLTDVRRALDHELSPPA